ncbi:MAG: hypothetical protein IKF83_00835 [Clostridia bacterium]|nr:hypothetical protein [Clostridia bacterium]
MTKQLANSGLDGKKILVVGADEEVLEDIFAHYKEQGMRVACLRIPDKGMVKDCDVIITQVFWDDEHVYVAPIDGPNLLVERSKLSKEQVMDQITGFLEAINF